MKRIAKDLWRAEFILVACACIGLAGCAAEQPDELNPWGGLKVEGTALAKVGQGEIDEREFRRYEANIQTQHRSPNEGVEKYREHLLTLIDIKLMVREAEERGLDKSPELANALERTEHKAMVEAFMQERIGLNIEITEAELRATFDAHPARYAVLGAHILLRDRAQADSVHSEIEQGRATFEEMARKHSLDENTAKEGGVFKTYYAYDRVSDAIYKQVFSLDVGKVSEPFRSPQGWEVAKVVDKKLVPFEKYRTVIQRVTFLKKLEELKRSHIAELVEKSNLRPVVENLYRFIAAWNENPGSPKLTPEELAKPLYTYEDGMISLQQVSYLLHNIRLGHVQVDSTLIEDKVRNRGASDLLLGIAAKEAGLDDRPIVQEQVKAERERLLVEGLWDELLEIQLEINEVEARTHYDAHPEMYKIPEEIIIQEIMVADIDRANSLLNEVRAGADMADLATRHSIRRYSDENGGLYAMRSFERIVYNEVMDAAVKAPDNELQGPIELVKPMPSALRDQLVLDRAFSIFKVLQRLPERVQTFELSQRKAEFFARQEKQQDQLQKLNLELRRKYNKDWGINDRALEEYAEVLSIR
jgi:parvulin-like peptidyl-prolyl isomerase